MHWDSVRERASPSEYRSRGREVIRFALSPPSVPEDSRQAALLHGIALPSRTGLKGRYCLDWFRGGEAV